MDYEKWAYEQNENRLGAIINTLVDHIIASKGDVVSWTKYYMEHKMPSMGNDPLSFPFKDSMMSMAYLRMLSSYLVGDLEMVGVQEKNDFSLSSEMVESWVDYELGVDTGRCFRVYDVREDRDVFRFDFNGKREGTICDVPVHLKDDIEASLKHITSNVRGELTTEEQQAEQARVEFSNN